MLKLGIDLDVDSIMQLPDGVKIAAKPFRDRVRRGRNRLLDSEAVPTEGPDELLQRQKCCLGG